MSIKLQQFVLDDAQKEEVRMFVMSYLYQKTVERVFGGKDVGGIKDAKELLDSAFTEMERIYKPKKDKPLEEVR